MINPLSGKNWAHRHSGEFRVKFIKFLLNAGLQWSASYRGTTNKADDGKVAAQNPQPGSLVPQGSIIKLEIYQVQTKR